MSTKLKAKQVSLDSPALPRRRPSTRPVLLLLLPPRQQSSWNSQLQKREGDLRSSCLLGKPSPPPSPFHPKRSSDEGKLAVSTTRSSSFSVPPPSEESWSSSSRMRFLVKRGQEKGIESGCERRRRSTRRRGDRRQGSCAGGRQKREERVSRWSSIS